MAITSYCLFVSYNRNDILSAKCIEKVLHANGLRAWRDLEFLPYGVDTEDEIRIAIRDYSKAFIILVTNDSMKSDFIWTVEIDEARKKLHTSKETFYFIPIFATHNLVTEFSIKSREMFGEDLSDKNGIILQIPIVMSGFPDLQRIAGRILEKLVYYEDYTRISLYTHGEIPRTKEPELTIDLRDSFKDNIPDANEWKDIILPGFRNIKAALLHKEKPQNTIWLPRRIHLSAAFAFGWVFRETSDFTFIASDLLMSENPESDKTEINMPLMTSMKYKGDGRKKNLALLVSIAKDVSPTFDHLVQSESYTFRECVALRLNQIGSKAIFNTTHAKLLAKQTVLMLLAEKDSLGLNHTDLFISASVQYATYLGYYLNACGSFTFWQYSMLDDIHKPSISLTTLFDNDT